ncbi:MAG: hypothetical protein MUF85_00850 [Patescibacteria group bacterium]|jgi:hypothetical protein|nr:hypothetical protein [Patescibacteria group bacterium]
MSKKPTDGEPRTGIESWQFTPATIASLGNIATILYSKIHEPHHPYTKPEGVKSEEISNIFRKLFDFDILDLEKLSFCVRGEDGLDRYPNLERFYLLLEAIIEYLHIEYENPNDSPIKIKTTKINPTDESRETAKEAVGTNNNQYLERLYQLLEMFITKLHKLYSYSGELSLFARNTKSKSADKSSETKEVIDTYIIHFKEFKLILRYLIGQEVDDDTLGVIIYELLAEKARFIYLEGLGEVHLDGHRDVRNGVSHSDHRSKSPFGFDPA